MKDRLVAVVAGAVVLAGALWLIPQATDGQSSESSTPASGVPRTTDGKPDLSGIWQAVNSAWWDIEDHVAQPNVPAGQSVVEGGELPYQTWAVAKRRENFANRATADTESKCFLPGVPRITYLPFPFQIVQTAERVSFLYEYAHTMRIAHTNGSKHLEGSDIGFWMGDSRGRWEGDTLVVDVMHFNDQTWFDRVGNFHSDALHVVERYTLTSPDHIDYHATIEDPKVFTRPWTMRMPLYRRKDANMQLLEYECHTFERWPVATE